MSGKKDQKNEENTEQKVMTKYDRKMEERKIRKEKERKEKLRLQIIGFVVLAAFVCFVLSFPIRTILTLNGTYIKVGGEKVTKLEYDYYYNLAKSDYYNQYGAYMAYFGFDITGDLSTQMYSDTMTWKDYFDQTTVENLKQNKALLAEAKKDGFEFDTSEEYQKFVDGMKSAASEAGVSEREYLQQVAGEYATLGRISKYVKEALFINNYYEQKQKEFEPSDSEIESYYQEHKDTYDSFDYRMTTIQAELPTEPTELADAEPVYAEDGSYTPSEAEIAKAMETAKEKADAEEKKVAETGEEYSNVLRSGLNSYIMDWMTDSSRKAGDTTVIENQNSHRYYVVAFEKRYLDTTATVNARILYTSEGGEDLLAAWQNGEATEESFAKLCDENSLDTSVEGGLYEGLSDSGMGEEMSEWLFDESRKHGDATAVTDDGYTYVIYYVGKNDPVYKLNISTTLTASGMNEFLEEISEKIEVEDPKGNLSYLTVASTESAEEFDVSGNE